MRPWEQAPESLWRGTRQRHALGQSCCRQAATHRAAVSVSLRKVLKVLATGEPQKQVVPELEPTCTERFFQVKGLRAQEQQEVAPGQLAQILAVHPTPLLAGVPKAAGHCSRGLPPLLQTHLKCHVRGGGRVTGNVGC